MRVLISAVFLLLRIIWEVFNAPLWTFNDHATWRATAHNSTRRKGEAILKTEDAKAKRL